MRLPLPVVETAARPTSALPPSRVLNIAHRGASDLHPENTLTAIRDAVDTGADLVEVDVRRTRDGALVLMHDATLSRTTNARHVLPARGSWSVDSFTYDEVARLDAGAWKTGEAGEPVPTLDDALDAVAHSSTGLLVELKAPELYPGIVADVVATLRARGDAAVAGQVVVQSFNVAAMKEHKTQTPSIPVGLLGHPARENLAVLGTWADQVNPHHLAVDKAYVDRVHELGMACLMWTVDHRATMRRALRLGADGVITNRPHVLSRLLGGRIVQASSN